MNRLNDFFKINFAAIFLGIINRKRSALRKHTNNVLNAALKSATLATWVMHAYLFAQGNANRPFDC